MRGLHCRIQLSYNTMQSQYLLNICFLSFMLFPQNDNQFFFISNISKQQDLFLKARAIVETFFHPNFWMIFFSKTKVFCFFFKCTTNIFFLYHDIFRLRTMQSSSEPSSSQLFSSVPQHVLARGLYCIVQNSCSLQFFSSLKPLKLWRGLN